jgi:hypothetical protein
MQQGKDREYLGWILNFVFGGLHYEKVLITLEKSMFGPKFLSSCWKRCTRKNKCNVESVCQLRTCSEAEKNHVKYWLNWLLKGPSESTLNYSQPYGVQASELLGKFLWRLVYIIHPHYTPTFSSDSENKMHVHHYFDNSKKPKNTSLGKTQSFCKFNQLVRLITSGL